MSTKRYSIMVIEYGSDREIELCQTDGDPDSLIAAAQAKMLTVYKSPGATRRSRTYKYTSIRIVDREARP